jgi:hypothetical protein
VRVRRRRRRRCPKTRHRQADPRPTSRHFLYFLLFRLRHCCVSVCLCVFARARGERALAAPKTTAAAAVAVRACVRACVRGCEALLRALLSISASLFFFSASKAILEP